MRLRYARAAHADFASILAYIAARSPRAADRVRARIEATIDRLLTFPGLGLQTEHPLIRRTIASPYPYFIFYSLTEAEIVILGIRHTARDPASMPGSVLES